MSARNEAAEFGELYERHFVLVWRALRRYGVPVTELEDALQEVFLLVHDKRSSFEGRSSLRTWIYGIARRVARNHRPSGRLEMTDPGLLDELTEVCPEQTPAPIARENARLLYSLLAQLTPERREIVVLVELEQMSVAEAALVLDENPNTAQSRLRQARVDLGEAWERLKSQEEWSQRCTTMNR